MLDMLMLGNRETPEPAFAEFSVTEDDIRGGDAFKIYPTIQNGFKGAKYRWELSGPGTAQITSPLSGEWLGPGSTEIDVTTKPDDGTLAFNEHLIVSIYNVSNNALVGSYDRISITYLEVPTGQQSFITTGTYSFTVPENVTTLSAITIGGGQGATNVAGGRGGVGGDTRWAYGIEVTPGETLTIEVGAGGLMSGDPETRNGKNSAIRRGTEVLLRASGGGRRESTDINLTTEEGRFVFPDNGFVVGGGNGGVVANALEGNGPSGGGGAGGYLGAGGRGGDRVTGAGNGAEPLGRSGGGAGGGAYYYTSTNDSHHATAGGGVGLLGLGRTGEAGVRNDPMSGGEAGSGGTDGSWTQAGLYGGGAKGRSTNNSFGAVNGGNGAVRLIWGVGRRYPNVRTGNL